MNDLDRYLPLIGAGDASAFAAWLAGAEEPVRRSLRSFAAVVDTEAVLQEALLRVWQVAGRVQPDGRPNALLRFALRVARNAAIDEQRRTRLQPTDPDDLELHLGAVAPVEPDPLLRARLIRCLELLRGPPSVALRARLDAHGGEPDRALAAASQMALNTFLKNVGRAKAALVDCLARAGIQVGVA